jgi:hypothetical protein
MLVAKPHTPFVHENVAAPTLVALMFFSPATTPPDGVKPMDALQLLEPTAQVTVPGWQSGGGGGARHVTVVGALHAPAVQENVAVPKRAVSSRAKDVPDGFEATGALQLFMPLASTADHVNVFALQGGGTQVADVAPLHIALLHENVAEPVLGAVASKTLERPDCVNGAEPVH